MSFFFVAAQNQYNDDGPAKVLMDEFFGVNGGQAKESPKDIKLVANWLRDYSQWEWLEPHKGQYKFTDALGTINYDLYYRKLKAAGIKSLFVVQKTPEWISSGKYSNHPREYAPSGDQDGLEPGQYKEAASFFYQLAARYGREKIPSGYLKTKDKISGLNLMDVIEVYNEPDATWSNNHLSLKQYAALLNSVYDGNNGSMKGQYGIKAADPDMLVSIGGMAGNLQSMKKVVKFAGRAPFDIINAHYYTFRRVREKYRVAVAPEWSSLVTDMKDLVEWGRKYAPGRPVWLTEIGWDTKDYNPEHVSEQEASDYLIRSYLLALGTGVEKCFWFIFSDLDKTPPFGVFSSSGLFENESIPHKNGSTQLKPKLTFWYNATFKHLTSGYYFESNRSFPNQDSTIYCYQFSTKDSSKKMAILWYCPRFQYAFRPLNPRPSQVQYLFHLSGNTWKIKRIIRPIAGTMDGQPQVYKVLPGSISLSLDATPVFIELVRRE